MKSSAVFAVLIVFLLAAELIEVNGSIDIMKRKRSYMRRAEKREHENARFVSRDPDVLSKMEKESLYQRLKRSERRGQFV